ncbi:DNA-3-methyladenine glycosylase family protein [Carnobacterium gallinarum]|uniref:DNA-3-methyladenine glycosylase family protein n=1 Tax=Carnobacterium gallinarum TaxID=2749 RepID=UPI000555E82F|nr:DNA-3-methyladenine glycosylase [Carnobacterium gallinarum]
MEETTLIQIHLPQEFDYQINLSYLMSETNECLYRIENQTIRRIIPTSTGPVLVAIAYHEAHLLQVTSLNPEKTLKNPTEIIDYLQQWFDLKTNLAPFYTLAKQDTLLQEPTERFYGLRLIGIPDLFEALAWGIIGQQINLTFAYTLKQRFIQQYGTSLNFGGQLYWAFPTAEKIAKLLPSDLASLQLSSRKSDYLIGVANLIASGELSKEKLLSLADFQSCERNLIKIRGIGPWTANYVLMRCLRFPNAFPVDDIGLINAIKFSLNLPDKPTKTTILHYAKAWTNWEAYATFYLWRLLY